MDIDFVVLWVDGNDPEWLKEKAEYREDTTDESNSVNRFRDWGLMKYWFRGVEKYAPWVRKVHFVTWGHLPDFLDISSPKLQIVKHTDYLKKEYLPTFSSHTLEMNIHRIPGLAEHFVYFNDDMFLLRPVEKDYFFDTRNCMPRVYCVEMPLRITGTDIFIQKIQANDLGVLNRNFPRRGMKVGLQGRYLSRKYDLKDNMRNLFMKYLFPEYFTGYKIFHSPAAFLKETFEEIWEKEPELLDRTSRNKFRDTSDINQWLALYWQMAKGNFSAGYTGKDNYLTEITDNNVDSVCSFIRNPERTMICLNDPYEIIDFEVTSKKLQKAFDACLPEKSSFEK